MNQHIKSSKEITRQYLEELGITEVTEDGRVFKNGVEKVPVKLFRNSKMRGNHDTGYRQIVIQKQGNIHQIMLHRLVYAWFNGVCPANTDIDHIDNDKSNNSIDNLQLLTREDNLMKKPISRNQYSWNKSDEEILEARKNRAYIYDREKHAAVVNTETEAYKKRMWEKEQKQMKKERIEKLQKEYKQCKADLVAAKYLKKSYKQEGNLEKWHEYRDLEVSLLAKKSKLHMQIESTKHAVRVF